MSVFFLLTSLLALIATPIMFFTHKQQRKYVLLIGLTTIVISCVAFDVVTPNPAKTTTTPADKPAVTAPNTIAPASTS